jgi:uncharacterized protein with HEPN domain
VIGQAVTNLSEHTRSLQPDIRWKQIAGLRDKVIHDDFGVDLEIVWAVVQRGLPRLNLTIDSLLDDASLFPSPEG